MNERKGAERAHASLLTMKAILINLLYEAQAATEKKVFIMLKCVLKRKYGKSLSKYCWRDEGKYTKMK